MSKVICIFGLYKLIHILAYTNRNNENKTSNKMGRKIKVLLNIDEKVKAYFLKETNNNSSNMSRVTEKLWMKYVVDSVKARQDRANKIKNNEV